MIDQATRLLGRLSHNVALAIAPSRDTHAFKHVQLLWLSARTSLIVIVVTSMGVAAQELVEWKVDVEADQLTRLSNALNAVLGGKVMEDIAPAAIDRVCEGSAFRPKSGGAPNRVPQRAPHAIRRSRPRGAQNLLDQPEFHDLRKLRSILRIVEEQKVLYDLIADDLAQPQARRWSTSVPNSAPTRWRSAASSPCRIVSATAAWGCSRSSDRGACRTGA